MLREIVITDVNHEEDKVTIIDESLRDALLKIIKIFLLQASVYKDISIF